MSHVVDPRSKNPKISKNEDDPVQYRTVQSTNCTVTEDKNLISNSIIYLNSEILHFWWQSRIMIRSILLSQICNQLQSAPQRYWYFFQVSLSTPIFPECDTNNNCMRRWSVGWILFPVALVIYAISVAVSNVLRYSLLQIIVPSSLELPLLIGVTDSILAALDVIVRIHGKWGVWKSLAVGTPTAPIVSSILYSVGIIIQLIGITTRRYSYGIGVVSYTMGAFLMSSGKGFLWNIWTQVMKPAANQQLLFFTEAHSQEVDFHGKMAQTQVVLRYFASSGAPLIVAFCLRSTNITVSYALTAFSFILLSIWIMHINSLLSHNDDTAPPKKNVVKKHHLLPSKTHIVTWNEMLPAWSLFNITAPREAQSTVNESMGLLVSNIDESTDAGVKKVGRFSNAFFHCGMFSCLTESVRNGYTRIICLRATTLELSDTQLAQILCVVGSTAVLTFWLSDIADTNRRLAAFLSFAILAVGHFGLACCSSSISMNGFYLSGIFFGLGEGLSTGLRALIKQDYLSENGPLRTKIMEHENGTFIRRQVCQKIGVWADATLVVNSIIVGVLGHFLGMRIASCLYGLLGLYGAYFSIYVMPDSKPMI